MYEKKRLFKSIAERVQEVATEYGLKEPQAFARWFAELYFERPADIFCSDGTKDGKVDLFCTTHDQQLVYHNVLNTKYTEKYLEAAPIAFYDEITRFSQAFRNVAARGDYLDTVRKELRSRYNVLFDSYDRGRAKLFFVTNYKRNEAQAKTLRKSGVHVFHLEDLIQFVADYIEDAMPHTKDLQLTGIHSTLTPVKQDSRVPTTIVFAKLVDFIEAVRADPYGLLFARNVRSWLGKTQVNDEIQRTFREEPKEFVFSHNGITMLCNSMHHDLGSKELVIENPRVVNGAQTLYSIRDLPDPSDEARVMVRIIVVPALDPNDLSADGERRRELVRKIAMRTNRQNRIKRWNLVANDEFQNSLARYFRRHQLFYERREGEWRLQGSGLKSVGIKRGPNLKQMAQWIASTQWSAKQLGPAIAKGNVDELFEDEAYEKIARTKPEIAYRIYLLQSRIGASLNDLADKRRYIANLRRHIGLSLIAVALKALDTEGLSIRDDAIKRLGELTALWTPFIKTCVDQINQSYKSQAAAYRVKTGKDLSVNNFFKTQTYLQSVLNGVPTPAQRRAARKLVKGSG